MSLDYSSWPIEEISADRTDMPPHLKAIWASSLNVESLKRAESMFREDLRTQSVQIEVPVSERLLSFSEIFRRQVSSKDLILDPVRANGKLRTSDSLQQTLKRRFVNLAKRIDQTDKPLMHQWGEMNVAMPKAASEIWPHAYYGFNSWRTAVETSDNLYPHPHFPFDPDEKRDSFAGRYPGFYLNLTQAKIGTVFFDKDSHTLWQGKSWAYNIFATKGHQNIDGCLHAVPGARLTNGEKENRFTDIMRIYPRDENGEPMPY